jgi:queuine tRNA-ribosyltransferase
VARGVDIFDCVLPTRLARHGAVFTSHGRVNLHNARLAGETAPIEPGCECYACRNFSLAYIRHLFKAGEILGLHLATVHNLHFLLALMGEIRRAICAGTFGEMYALYHERSSGGGQQASGNGFQASGLESG